MTDLPSIELLPGETLVDALTRQARERAANEIKNGTASTALPPVGRRAPKARGGPKSQTKVKKQDQALIQAEALGGDPNSGSPVENQILQAIHFYRRDGETWQKVAARARQELDMHGPTTVVFAHDHQFGGNCTRECKVRVSANDD